MQVNGTAEIKMEQQIRNGTASLKMEWQSKELNLASQNQTCSIEPNSHSSMKEKSSLPIR